MKYPNSTPLTLSFVFLFIWSFSLQTYAQESIVTYLKKNGGTTPYKDSADYTQIIRTEANELGLYELNEYYTNGNLKRHGWIQKANPDPSKIRFEGWVDRYYENGTLAEQSRYKNNQKIDTASIYHPNGVLKERISYLARPKGDADTLSKEHYLRQVYYADSLGKVMVKNGQGQARIQKNAVDVEEGTFKDGLRIGRWTGTSQKGKYRFEEWYKDGIVIRGVSTDSLGKTYPYEQREIKAEYPQGLHALRQMVGRNFRYPKTAIKEGVNGLLLITFVVNGHGEPQDFEYLQDLGFGTAEAGEEAIRRAGKWKPGYQRGIPVKMRFTFPIRLNLKASGAPKRASPSSGT